jgi:hypothetical protein
MESDEEWANGRDLGFLPQWCRIGMASLRYSSVTMLFILTVWTDHGKRDRDYFTRALSSTCVALPQEGVDNRTTSFAIHTTPVTQDDL